MIFCAVAAGCSADRPCNPSFPVPMAEAKAILRQMQDDPKPLERPLVVAGGIHDPGFVTGRLARSIRRATETDDLVITVNFTGFGKFSVNERGPRQGVNPRTGERITIPGGKVPKFSAGAGLKAAVKD